MQQFPIFPWDIPDAHLALGIVVSFNFKFGITYVGLSLWRLNFYLFVGKKTEGILDHEANQPSARVQSYSSVFTVRDRGSSAYLE